MSAPDAQPVTPSAPSAAGSKDGMFAAYLEEKRRSPWPWVLLGIALIGGVVLSFRTAPRAIYQVETRAGVVTLNSGMDTAQVEQALGHPIGSERENGLECRRYGQPRFDRKFWVYSVCYDGERLVSLRAAQLEAKRIQNIPHLLPSAPAPAP